MKRYRQWLTETQDHMTESPDGDWVIYTEALAAIEAAVKAREKELEVELSNLALAHEADRKPLVDELIKEQKYILKLEAAVKEITESRDEWKRQWRLMEAAEKKAEEQIATLQEETSRLYAITVEQSKQITTLNDALSGRDNVIEKLKGYLANKKTDIAEKVEYIAALTAELKSLTEAYNNTDWKKRTDVLIEVIKLVYRKHHLNDDSIGWEELSYTLHNTIYEAIGDQEYLDWINALKKGKEAGG